MFSTRHCKPALRSTVLCLAVLTALSACGGGGGTGTTTTPVASASAPQDGAVGTITGFGSVIINGVRYDDSAATVKDDSGNTIASSKLALGMTVQLKGKNNDDGSGSASGIDVFSELQGPVSALNLAGSSFSLFGFTVQTNAKTVFADATGLSALADGNIVEVYGLRNGTTITATRIERKTPAAGAVVVKLRGALSGLNSASTSFTLGGLVINYGSATVLPAASSLSEGGYVAISATSLPSGTNLSASRVVALGSKPVSFEDGARSELEGVISNFTSASQFTVGSITVDASKATFVRGTLASLANGARVEIKGTTSNNVLTARLVKFDDGSASDDFELHGTVSSFASLSSFVVRGVTVDASGSAVLFERGAASDLANGRAIEVEGNLQASSSGSVLKATKISFEDVSAGTGSVGGQTEWRGKVSSVSGNTLVVGTRTVTVSAATVYRRISQAQLVTGVLIEVRGTVQGDGSIKADRITLED